jgi:hypothetical protein
MEADHSNRNPLSQKWDAEHRPEARKLDGLFPNVFRVKQNVGDVNRFLLKCSSPRESFSPERYWIPFLHSINSPENP